MLAAKFRAIEKRSGEMIYGFHVVLGTREFFVRPGATLLHQFLPIPYVRLIEIIPESVGMRLGWKNKYDQELWEGDILEGDGGWRRVIVYDPVDHWGWCFNSGASISDAYHWKVVGNIHQHLNMYDLGEPEHESN